MARERVLLITGKLAEFSLKRLMEQLRPELDFDFEIRVLGITVAALMHTGFVKRKLELDSDHGFDRAILTGWCQGDMESLAAEFGMPFELGPKDLADLPEYLTGAQKPAPDLSQYDIEMLAEINFAPRLTDHEILKQAESFRASGADIIDLGCVPGECWSGIGAVTRLLIAEGFRVSVDSFDQAEVETAVRAGAELVLSCNSTNLQWASRLPVELVAIPDSPRDFASLELTVTALTERNVQFRIDPILEPIGFGFAESLARYYEARRIWPDAAIMMGIGNLTELTDVDTAGVNFILAAVCQELRVHSVLTTEVINWAQSAVAEFDVARRLVKHSLDSGVLPKHLDNRLVMLRDPKLNELGPESLQKLASNIRDPNYRIFVEAGEIHIMNRDSYWQGTDPFEWLNQVAGQTKPLDASHAFYLGYELSKAVTALHLGKQYTQDEGLHWGLLSFPDPVAVEQRHVGREE